MKVQSEAGVARVEGRAYCLMCALLIPTTNTEIKKEKEGAKEISPMAVCNSSFSIKSAT